MFRRKKPTLVLPRTLPDNMQPEIAWLDPYVIDITSGDKSVNDVRAMLGFPPHKHSFRFKGWIIIQYGIPAMTFECESCQHVEYIRIHDFWGKI